MGYEIKAIQFFKNNPIVISIQPISLLNELSLIGKIALITGIKKNLYKKKKSYHPN